MLKTKIPMRRKVPVLSGQKVVLMDADELNPGLAEFLHPKPKAKDEAVECKDHEVAGCKDQDSVECKDHEAAGDNPPSKTTLAEAEDMEQNPSTSSNPNGQYVSLRQVSQLQELAKEPKSSEEPVEIGKRGQFITTLPEEETMKQNPSGCNPTGPNTSQRQVSQLQELAKEPKSADISPRGEPPSPQADPVELEERGLFITEHQMGQIKELAKEQEHVSKILQNLSQNMKTFLKDIRKKEGKWPQSRREITGVVMAVILALFIVVVCLFIYFYLKPAEIPVPTWWEYITSIVMRFISFY